MLDDKDRFQTCWHGPTCQYLTIYEYILVRLGQCNRNIIEPIVIDRSETTKKTDVLSVSTVSLDVDVVACLCFKIGLPWGACV